VESGTGALSGVDHADQDRRTAAVRTLRPRCDRPRRRDSDAQEGNQPFDIQPDFAAFAEEDTPAAGTPTT
jgi:hypothetical protein